MISTARTFSVQVGLLISTAISIAAPACAQTSPSAEGAPAATQASSTSPGAADQAAKATGGLTDIVVTARKQVENVQNVPIADTVVSPKQLQTYSITSVEKIAILAPQLIVGRNGSGNGASIGLRGISVDATSISLQQSVATIIDGVYYNGGRSLNVGLFDLAQVEVLKGPQSLFYGKNTTAGAISVTTADPTRTLQGAMKVGYEFNAKNPYIEGYISGPITDTLSYRIAARFTDEFGYLIKNVSQAGTTYTKDVNTGIVTAHARPAGNGNTPGERNGTVRASLKYDSGGFTAVLKGTYDNYHSNTPNSSAVIGYCASGKVQSDPSAPCGKIFAQIQSAVPADIAATNKYLNKYGGADYLDYESLNATANLAYHTDKVDFTLTPAYTKQVDSWVGDFDFTDNYSGSGAHPVGTVGTGGNNPWTHEYGEATSVEARARTHLGGRINFMVGGYFQHFKQYFNQGNIFPGGTENDAAPLVDRYLATQKIGNTLNNTYAGFGQLIYDVTDNLNVSAGVRYTHETNDSTLDQPYVSPASLKSFAVNEIGANQKFNNTSPEATITWKPVTHVTLYASYRTGYKSGGFSISGTLSPATTAANASFGPEKVSGFEGGVKTTLFDNQLRLNADAFDYKYTGLQADYFDPLTIEYLTINAGAARTRGFEVESEFAPRAVPGLDLHNSLAYTDAFYSSFPIAPCLGGELVSEGCNLLPNAAGVYTKQSLTGQRTPQAPKWTATASVDYSTAIGRGLKSGFSVNIRYSGRYKTYAFAPDNAARYFQAAYAAIDASVNIAQEADRWMIQLVGKNLTDHFITTSAFDLTYTGSAAGTPNGVHSDTRNSVDDPRTVALEATIKF